MLQLAAQRPTNRIGKSAMNSTLIFLVQALVLVALPVVVLRFSGLKGRIPLVVVQIVVGIALGPSLFGRLGARPL